MNSKYAEAGVDVRKRGIEVFKTTVRNLFPEAFCAVAEDPDLPGYGIVTHADSAGSKPVQTYLNWKVTGNLEWFKGLAQDVLAMNLNDITCVGAKAINFVDYVALNPLKVPKAELLGILNSGFKQCFETLERYGVKMLFSGGETADLPDQIQTFDISGVINGRVELAKALTGLKISPGDLIIGLRSGGKTKYEDKETSGIMCNGLTLARLCLMKGSYQEKYPEIVGSGGRRYYGRFAVDDYLDELSMTVGEALTSPMRFFAPVVVKVLEKYGSSVSGLSHNMGGGLAKCLRLGRNVHFMKDNLFDPDPIFKLIQKESRENWKAMFENYNMGVGFEIITKPDVAEDILSIPERFGLQAKIIGKCFDSRGTNRVTVVTSQGKFQYS